LIHWTVMAEAVAVDRAGEPIDWGETSTRCQNTSLFEPVS